MRSYLFSIAALLACGGYCSVEAGIYIPGLTPEITVKDGKAQAMPFDQIKIAFVDAINLASGQQSKLGKEYEEACNRLLAKGVDNLDETEVAELSGREIRLRQLNRALELLRNAEKKFPNSFVIHSHLALVSHLQKDPEAPRLQLEASRMHPKQIPGLAAEQVPWALRLERLLFELERNRFREERDTGIQASNESLDSILPITFVGPSGQYEAGKISSEESTKIPEDALTAVQQLLLWLPDDIRLCWLLAELYNAQGDISAANFFFDYCANKGFQPPLLRAHRRVVLEAAAAQPAAGFANLAERIPSGEKNAGKGNSWKDHPEAFVIVGSIVAVPLLVLIFWQIRLFARRLGAGGEYRAKT
ncbi:MAG TPA: hypothetical protein VGZ47_21990 [Gemmataceae bacterium]|jgi:hypothetical protein|nr:hypothetical protein [Gemmataceae bacterium]